MLEYMLERLEEPSTWRGIVMLMTAFGLTISPEKSEAIISTGMAFAGLIAVFTKDHKPSIPTQEEVEIVQAEVEEKIDRKRTKKSSVTKKNPKEFLGD